MTHEAIGIVILMGGLHYAVDLSSSYVGADYTFSYSVDGITGNSKITKTNEGDLVKQVFSHGTKWNDIAFSGGYFGSLVPKSPEYEFSVRRIENS